MDTVVVTKAQLQKMHDKAGVIGILPFIEIIAFSGEGQDLFAKVFYMKPRQRKQKWLLYAFAKESFFTPHLPRRSTAK